MLHDLFYKITFVIVSESDREKRVNEKKTMFFRVNSKNLLCFGNANVSNIFVSYFISVVFFFLICMFILLKWLKRS